MTAAPETREVWLRGNPRPAVAGAAVFLVGLGAAGVAFRLSGWPAWAGWTLAAAAAAGGLVVAALVAVAALPRLVRRGAALRIRLAPLATHDVPLELVECVFPGSSPLAGAADGPAPRRVGTVVVRLAERAVDWRRRPTFTAWGTWDDGHVVIDGRWCEPLSVEVTRRLGQRIVDAKREIAAAIPQAAAR